jgi:DNA invertase Pin-like site-specific DNA recombinase
LVLYVDFSLPERNLVARRTLISRLANAEQGFKRSDWFTGAAWIHAQREACELYAGSQRAEGWVLVDDHYDDGGFSGGTLERPALKQLLVDIEAGLVDIVVVYKIDRLSRSLIYFTSRCSESTSITARSRSHLTRRPLTSRSDRWLDREAL